MDYLALSCDTLFSNINRDGSKTRCYNSKQQSSTFFFVHLLFLQSQLILIIDSYC